MLKMINYHIPILSSVENVQYNLASFSNNTNFFSPKNFTKVFFSVINNGYQSNLE